MLYILALIVSACLIAGQASWGTAVKHIVNSGIAPGSIDLLLRMPLQVQFWLGTFAYIVATGLYFILLSKAHFFSIQMTMSAVAIILSTALSVILFKESISVLNYTGIVILIAGVFLATYK